MGVAAVGLPLGVLSVVAAPGTASASGAITANGTITCNSITGSITFKPPLVNNGSAPETSTAKITESGCTDTSTNLPAGTVVTGSVKTTLSNGSSTDSCTSLLTSSSESLPVKWSGKSGKTKVGIEPSVVAFSGYNVVSNSKGDEGFQLPGNGSGGSGTASATGSFTGTDGGASSSAVVYSTSTAGQLLSECGKKGIKKLTINKSGSTATIG